jgi:hypothetical protein
MAGMSNAAISLYLKTILALRVLLFGWLLPSSNLSFLILLLILLSISREGLERRLWEAWVPLFRHHPCQINVYLPK